MSQGVPSRGRAACARPVCKVSIFLTMYPDMSLLYSMWPFHTPKCYTLERGATQRSKQMWVEIQTHQAWRQLLQHAGSLRHSVADHARVVYQCMSSQKHRCR